MGIEDAINAFFEELQRTLAREIRNKLTYLGIEAVNRVRETHPNDWTDQTSNLRSSTGWAYYEEAKKQVQSAFDAVKPEGIEGSETGKKLVEELAKELSDKYAIAVVAGMDYAEFVEAKGKDVLASTEAWMREEVNARLQEAIDATIDVMNKKRIG